MLMKVNGVDITPYINSKSYEMNEESQFESWMDGNYVEHRIYTRPRVHGTFDVILFGLNDMDTEAFLTNWNAAVNNHVLTAQVFVQNTNIFKTVNAFFTFNGTFHREMINGNYCDKLTVEIQER